MPPPQVVVVDFRLISAIRWWMSIGNVAIVPCRQSTDLSHDIASARAAVKECRLPVRKPRPVGHQLRGAPLHAPRGRLHRLGDRSRGGTCLCRLHGRLPRAEPLRLAVGMAGRFVYPRHTPLHPRRGPPHASRRTTSSGLASHASRQIRKERSVLQENEIREVKVYSFPMEISDSHFPYPPQSCVSCLIEKLIDTQ